MKRIHVTAVTTLSTMKINRSIQEAAPSFNTSEASLTKAPRRTLAQLGSEIKFLLKVLSYLHWLTTTVSLFKEFDECDPNVLLFL